MSRDARPHVVLVGSGGQPYREYAFAALADRYRLSAVLPADATWQRPYLDAWRVADFGEETSVAECVSALRGGESEFGILTWDETVLEVTALVAEKLSLPHMSPRAAARCRDKYLTRSLLDKAGAPAVRYAVAESATDAVRAADALGYPVVVKPRTMAGSIGVTLATDAEEVREAFTLASTATYATLPIGKGVLVEEYLDGPEISVDSVVDDGAVTLAQVARKRLGFAPYFEEVGHLVTGWTEEPWAEQVRALITTAHQALGVERGVTHAEVRLTAAGPRLVELNGRLGGDLIPLVGRLATGVDLVRAAAELALGRHPDLTPRQDRAAEVRFVYPPVDGTVRRIDVTAAGQLPGVAHTAVLAEPGTSLRLPPHQAIPRLAALIAVATDGPACTAILDQAVRAVESDVEPLDAG